MKKVVVILALLWPCWATVIDFRDRMKFSNIETNDYNESECTPRIEGDFVGIRIVAQEFVSYVPGTRDKFSYAFGQAVMCGIYRFPLYFLRQTDGFERGATLVAVDTETSIAYSAKILHLRGVIPIPAAPPPDDHPSDSSIPSSWSNTIETGYFNINILDFLDLPERPATYRVFMTLLQYTSNSVVVRFAPTTNVRTEGPT